MQSNYYRIIGIVLLFMFGYTASDAQRSFRGKMGKKKGIKSIKKAIQPCKEVAGLFTLYQDTTSGSVFFKIRKDQIDKEFIYVSMLEDGVLTARHFRGAYQANLIFTIKKHYDRFEFVQENTGFYFDKNNALSKAADANISKAIIASEAIIAQDSAKENFLIKADGLFMSEKMTKINNTGFNPRAFKLGRISKEKSKYRSINSYPKNTDLVIEYVYENAKPRNFGGADVTDPRYVSAVVRHNFLEMPENDFQPRYDDPRIGYFLQQVNDMTATDATPYRDMINRWHLVKKDPNAALSEPVEPIVWWIENTTPEELRAGVKEGIEKWNKAFEKAGFKNAIVAKIQPDDADWEAGDVRYNVIRWTASPRPPFRGYGPSFVNPRTGQILGADVMLDYSAFKRIFLDTKPYDLADVDLASKLHPEEEENLAKHDENHQFCMAGDFASLDLMFADQVLRFDGADAQALKAMENELLVRLVMHEVGHTLGLMHNMRGTQMLSPEELNNVELTTEKGLQNSVMDYPLVNIAKDRSKQGHYYSMSTGPYDWWAIEYGYKPNLSEKDLQTITARSTEPDLAFGNDADAMSSSARGIDPRVMVYDMSNDVIGYSKERIELIQSMMKNLKDKYSEKGETYQELRTAYYIMYAHYLRSAMSVSRYVGGIYVDRAFQGQKGGTKPFTPVPMEEQKKALKLLSDYVFAPNAYPVPADLLAHLQIQRRGQNFFGRTENPKIHFDVFGIQRAAMSHLLHPTTLQRIIDSGVYGNEYTIDLMMKDLNDAMFKADASSNVNSYRQNLQIEYTKRLISMLDSDPRNRFPYQARSMALYNLQQVRKIAANGRGDLQTRAHKDHLITLIDHAIK
ncbi:MAG: zinc-dependent metalloprotease [Flammeovirgaceae bacterium]